MGELWIQRERAVAPNRKIDWMPGRQSSSNLRDYNLRNDRGSSSFRVSDRDGYSDMLTKPCESDKLTIFRITSGMIKGLSQEETERMLSGTMTHRLAIIRLTQGIVLDLAKLHSKLNQLLKNANPLKAMGEIIRERAQRLYQWEAAKQHWRSLLRDLQEIILCQVVPLVATPPKALPPWNTSLGQFATKVLPAYWSSQKISLSRPKKNLQAGMLKTWDQDLFQNSTVRKRDWWLKLVIAEA